MKLLTVVLITGLLAGCTHGKIIQTQNFVQKAPPRGLSISRSGSKVIVTFTGFLQSAPTITGPWTTVTGAVSPCVIEAAGPARYFRDNFPDLSGFLSDSVTSRIRHDLTVDLLYWKRFDVGLGIFEINSNFFLGTDLDFSGCSFWNGSQGGGGSGTLISSNVLICARHTYAEDGFWYTFIGRDGVRSVAQAVAHTNVLWDMTVVRVEPPLPDTNFTSYRILPPNYNEYFKHVWIGSGVDEGTLILVGAQRNAEQFPFGVQKMLQAWLRAPPPANDPLSPWSLDVVGGDSSHPSFFIAGNELVLMGAHESSYYDPPLADYYKELASAISWLTGDGTALRTLPLDKFKRYKP